MSEQDYKNDSPVPENLQTEPQFESEDKLQMQDESGNELQETPKEEPKVIIKEDLNEYLDDDPDENPEDEDDLQEEPQDEKKKWGFSPLRMVIAALIAIIAICGFILVNKKIDKRNASRCEAVSSKKHFTGVESMEISDNTLKLTGWCIKKGIDTVQTKSYAQVKVILMNTKDKNDKIFMDSEIIEDESLNERYPEKNYDYSYGGFEATVKASKLDLDSKDYEILVSKMDYAWESSRFCLTGIRTGYYIINGELKNGK